MSKIHISLASPLLALHGGWEAGMMNNHTPIMDNLTPPHTVSSRKRVRSNDSDDERNYDADVEDQNKPDWNLVWPRFIVLDSVNPSEPLTKVLPFCGWEGYPRKIWYCQEGDKDEIRLSPHRGFKTDTG